MNKKKIIEGICLVGIIGVFAILLWLSPLVAGIFFGVSIYCLMLKTRFNWIENIAKYIHKAVLHGIAIRRTHDIACLLASCIFLIGYVFLVTLSSLPAINVFILTSITTFVALVTSIMANCMYSVQEKNK